MLGFGFGFGRRAIAAQRPMKVVRGTGGGSTAGLELLTTRAPAGDWDTSAG